jgi:hypothetical protein
MTTKGRGSTEFLETDYVSRVKTWEDVKVAGITAQFVVKRACIKT